MIRKVKILLNVALYFLIGCSMVSCKKYERNTLYFTPPASILCMKNIMFTLEKYTINETEKNLGYNIYIMLRNSPTRYMALYEDNNRVYELDDSDFGCFSEYFPISPIKIKGSYRRSKKWKIIYLDKNKMEIKYIDEQNNTHVMSFKINLYYMN